MAQKSVATKGSSQVRMESNMTKEQARDKAEDLAMINAIENAFGTFVEQNADITVENGTVSYNIIGSTKVKGEWLRTDKKSFKEDIQDQLDNDQQKEKIIWISCHIEGEVRETRSRANLDIKLLRCPMVECETTSFLDTQSFYLYFKSPVDGYLSIFMDENNEATRRLFPYLNQGNASAVKIDGDRTYFLFTNSSDLNKYTTRADEIELYAYNSVEYNFVYVIFSPIPYCKPILSDASLIANGYVLPKAISTQKFQEWLADCRVAMPDFQAKRIKISISKN
jgi:hypothetical protein